MARVKGFVNQDGKLLGYIFLCPGCGHHHAVNTEEPSELGFKWIALRSARRST